MKETTRERFDKEFRSPYSGIDWITQDVEKERDDFLAFIQKEIDLAVKQRDTELVKELSEILINSKCNHFTKNDIAHKCSNDEKIKTLKYIIKLIKK